MPSPTVPTPSRPIAEMQRAAKRTLVDVHGFAAGNDGTFIGKHYRARITDKPGMTRGERCRSLCLPSPASGGDLYDDVVIEYY